MSTEERKTKIHEIIEMMKELEALAKKEKQGVTPAPLCPVSSSK